MTRSIGYRTGSIIESLELTRPQVVTTALLTHLAEEAGVRTPVDILAYRLRAKGWLLPTGQRGAWEFAPAERAGAYSSNDPYLAIRGVLGRWPDLPIKVALGSALWLHDLLDRAPNQPEIALPRMVGHLPALRAAARITHFESRLPAVQVQGLPVHHPATVVMQMATRPRDVRSWGAILEVLPHVLDRVSVEELATELEGRSRATRARLGYLLEGWAPEKVERLELVAADKVWFGPRTKSRRYSARWKVVDTILPYRPGPAPVSAQE